MMTFNEQIHPAGLETEDVPCVSFEISPTPSESNNAETPARLFSMVSSTIDRLQRMITDCKPRIPLEKFYPVAAGNKVKIYHRTPPHLKGYFHKKIVESRAGETLYPRQVYFDIAGEISKLRGTLASENAQVIASGNQFTVQRGPSWREVTGAPPPRAASR